MSGGVLAVRRSEAIEQQRSLWVFFSSLLGAYWSKGDIHRNASLNPSGSCQWSPRLHRCDYSIDGRDRSLFVGMQAGVPEAKLRWDLLRAQRNSEL
jgi:hypothetical protein